MVFMHEFRIYRAIDASLRQSMTSDVGPLVGPAAVAEVENVQEEIVRNPVPVSVGADELAIALAISLEEEERRRRLVNAEEEELAKALELSMKEM